MAGPERAAVRESAEPDDPELRPQGADCRVHRPCPALPGSPGEIASILDETGPVVSGATVAPNPVPAAQPATLTASAADPSAATPASVVTGAEWYEGTDPGAGNGHPMSATDGAFDTPVEGVRAVLNVSDLSAGTHTLQVRARDAAGNWGSATPASVTVLPSDTVFADGFETGNLSAWSSQSGGSTRIGVSTAAALTGVYGMRTVISGATPSWVQDDRPANQASAHVRFRFHPNGTTTSGLTTTTMLGRSGNGTALFRVEYRTSGGNRQLRALVHRTGGDTTTSWFTVTNTAHAVEIAWASAASSTFTLSIDGVVRQTVSGLSTGNWRLEMVRLGPSAGLATGVSGTEFYDDYVMTRTSTIGP